MKPEITGVHAPGRVCPIILTDYFDFKWLQMH